MGDNSRHVLSFIGEIEVPIASIIDWYGPYTSLSRLRSEGSEIATNRCVYMGIGGPPEARKVLYLGLSTRPDIRFESHHVLNSERIDSFYIGEITTSGLPGRRRTKVPSDLDATEHALISYLKPEMNVRRKTTLPRDCVAVFSRFFGKNNWNKPKPVPSFFPPIVTFNTYSGEWYPPRALD